MSMTASLAGLAPAPAARGKVLIVSPRYFPFSGGVQNHTYQIARRMTERGLDVTVLTSNPNGDLPASEGLDGVSVARVPALPRGRDYYFAPAMYGIIARGGWSVVHVQSYHTLVAPMAMYAAYRAGIPYVVTLHGGGHSSRLRQVLRGLHWRLLGPLLRRADRLIATARFEETFFGKLLGIPPEKFIYIPNGGDLPDIGAPPAPPTDRTLVVSIGRLERYKGHQRVIRAFPQVLAQRPDAFLWVAGAGPDEQKLKDLAAQLGIAERVDVRAVPASDRAEMARQLARAHLVVSMSDYETHPMAILEAVALRRSVLVADSPGLNEIAEDGMARAIPRGSNTAALAEAMLAQLAAPLDPPAPKLNTWDSCTDEVMALYRAVTAGRLATV